MRSRALPTFAPHGVRSLALGARFPALRARFLALGSRFLALGSRFLALGAVALAFSGCGYQSLLVAPPAATAAQGEEAGDAAARVARVSVVSLRNDSHEPWLERIVDDALRREISLRGAFALEDDPNRADFVVRGRILPLTQRGSSFSSLVVALEYRIEMALDLEVVRARGDVVRLAGAPLRESEIYLASPDIEITRTQRIEALRHLSDLLAVRVADSVEWIAR